MDSSGRVILRVKASAGVLSIARAGLWPSEVLLKRAANHSVALRQIRPVDAGLEFDDVQTAEPTSEDMATVWVSRVTGIVGGIFLCTALILWASRPGHYRLVLAFLVVAMLMAIIHSYTFENGGPS